MAHDVFISYANQDKATADAVCAKLEAHGIRCWIAPRDLTPGAIWAAEIVKTIPHSRVLVLIFSSHSNNSEMVNTELDIAVDSRLHIIPFRIEDLKPTGETKFYLARKHWLDALTPPLEQYLDELSQAVKKLLSLPVTQKAPPPSAPPTDRPEPARGVDPITPAPELDQPQDSPARFTVSWTGIIYDSQTRLAWFVGPDEDITWDAAKSWVDGLQVGDGGWRLPDRQELGGIYLKGVGTRNMDPVFKTSGWWVWSSKKRDASSAWLFNFGIGQERWFPRGISNGRRAFAVRSRR